MTQTFPARSPVNSGSGTSSGPARRRPRKAPDAFGDTAPAAPAGPPEEEVPEGLPGSTRVPEPSAPEQVRVNLKVPADMRARLEELARDRGVSKADFMRQTLERGLRMHGSRVMVEGAPGQPTMEHVGDPDAPQSGIPSGYFPPDTDEVEQGDGAEAVAAAGDPAVGDARQPPAAQPAVPPPEPEDDIEAVVPAAPAEPVLPMPGAGPLGLYPQYAPGPPVVVNTGGYSSLRAFLSFLGLLAAALLLVLLVAGTRYSVVAPDPGQYGSGAYLMDGWSGRVWYCESARRGLPRPVCLEFVRDSLSSAPVVDVSGDE